jgi:single-strand DNA-binding protein
MNINKYICTGRLTKDPELRALPSGTSVCQLRVAVDGMSRNREVGFINVSVYGSGGEAAAKYLSKGWLVAVDGRLEYGEWDADGARRHDYQVVGNVEFLSAPRAAQIEEPEEAKPERTYRKKQEPVAA